MRSPSPSGDAPLRALLLFAGNKRNDPRLGDERPALRIARSPKPGPIREVWVLSNEEDATTRLHADKLAEALGKGRRGIQKVHREALRVGGSSGADSSRSVQPGIRAFVNDLRHAQFGARFPDAEFVVSLETGSLAQTGALLDALHEAGARVAVAWINARGDVRAWRSNARRSTAEPDLSRLGDAAVAWNVLLTGPTGAGKSASASRLHDAWKGIPRRSGPFVPRNIASIPAPLIASELFGHAKGSFTGAAEAREGAFVAAKGGTLFLDEIGDLPLDLQVQLLTVLDPMDGQHRAVRRLGDARETRVNVRVIFGTNRDLWAMARAGTFRTDLLGRVSTHHVALPGIAAIRHRIVSAYQQQFEALAAAHGVDRITLHLDARTALFDFVFDEANPWHWNYRDVIQSAERLVLRARHGKTSAERLVVDVRHVHEELVELRSRWGRATGDPPAADDPPPDWERTRAKLTPARWEALSHVERWELSYLLAAQEATTSDAEAWRWIAARNLLAGARDPVTNPSNAFAKRWRRYRDLLRG